MPEITFDLDSLSIEEIEILEDVTDMPINEVIGKNVKKGKLLRAIAYIEGRRSDPSYTLEMAGKVNLAEGNPTQAGETSKDAQPASSDSSPLPKPQGSRSRT
jgi:hypothetical protein